MAERPVAVLGLDLGTTDAKAALVTPDGRVLGLGRAAHPPATGPDGAAEQDPRAWLAALETAVAAALASAPGAVGVAAVCPVAQGPTLAVLDAAGDPIRPAVTWQDRRIGARGFGILPRIAWLARAEPGSVAAARWLLPAWDALGLWLTGTAAWSLQGHETVPAVAELEALGVPADRVPGGIPFGSSLGTLRPEAAARLGLPAGIPVVAGVNDGAASVLGAGLRLPGDAVDTGGTSGGIAICSGGPVELPVAGLYQAPAPLPGRWIVGGAMAALGASLQWLAETVLGGRWRPEELLAAAAEAGPGAGGLVFLPYLAGERAPIFDDDARGAFAGLTLAHGRGHLVRAVLEGAAFALRHVAEPLAAAGAPVRELRLAGRTTPDDLWARIKADVLGVPVALPAVGETAVLGAAIIAASGAGLVAGLEDGVLAMARPGRRIEPDPGTRAVYDEAYAVYRALHPALRGIRPAREA